MSIFGDDCKDHVPWFLRPRRGWFGKLVEVVKMVGIEECHLSVKVPRKAPSAPSWEDSWEDVTISYHTFPTKSRSLASTAAEISTSVMTLCRKLSRHNYLHCHLQNTVLIWSLGLRLLPPSYQQEKTPSSHTRYKPLQ